LTDSLVLRDSAVKALSVVKSDVGKAYDYIEKFRGRRIDLADVAVTSDYMFKSVAKHLWDGLVGECSIVSAKGKWIGLVDVVVTSDYMCRGVEKVLVDAGRVGDFISKLPLKAFSDVGVVHDYVSRGVSKAFEFEAPSAGWVSIGAGKAVLDVGRVLEVLVLGLPHRVEVSDVFRGVDFLARGFGKALFDVAVIRDAAYRTITVVLRDWLVGEHVPMKGITIPRKDVSVATEYVRKGIEKRAVETIGVSDVVFKEIGKTMAETVHILDAVKKLSVKAFEDVSRAMDVVTKVGFKLAGYDVRRVYFLPTEFKALWDLISSQDHNTKVEVCKALIEAFKRVRDKLGE
jgi:hypothetical protein